MMGRMINLMAAATVWTLGFGTISAGWAEQIVGEIRSFGFNFCPRGWAQTDGSVLAIAEHTALFSLLGTQYGGDGRTTFALPDLRGRVALGAGAGPGLTARQVGARAGAEQITLNQTHLPEHKHDIVTHITDDPGDARGFRLTTSAATEYSNGGTSRVGQNQPIDIMPPHTVVMTCIALVGVYPSRN